MSLIKNILKNLKHAWLFSFVYLLFLIVITYFVSCFSKLDGTILVNKTWTSFQDVLFRAVTHLGGGEMALLTVFVIVVFISVRKGLITLICFVFTALITQFLKHVLYAETMRPFIALWDGFNSGELHLALPVELMKKANSFPSGHTTSAFSLFLIFTLYVKKPIFGLLFGVLAVLASYSRVYLWQHFFEDILFGSVIGFGGTILMYSYLDLKNFFSSLDISFINYIRNAKKTL